MLVGYYIIKYFYEVIVNKKGFSLFELILVIILIGLVYSLVLGKLDNKKNLKIKKLENLKAILAKKSTGKIDLIVYDGCKRVMINNKEIEFDSNLFKDIEVYSIVEARLEKIEFTPLYLKEKFYDVCLRYSIYENKSSSSYIIKKDKKYIVFYPYFKDSEVYLNESDAIEALSNQKLLDMFNNEN